MGAGDEIKSAVGAGVKAPFSDKDLWRYLRIRSLPTRAPIPEGFRERNPVVAPVSEVAGAVAGVLGTGGGRSYSARRDHGGAGGGGCRGQAPRERACVAFNAGEGGRSHA